MHSSTVELIYFGFELFISVFKADERMHLEMQSSRIANTSSSYRASSENPSLFNSQQSIILYKLPVMSMHEFKENVLVLTNILPATNFRSCLSAASAFKMLAETQTPFTF